MKIRKIPRWANIVFFRAPKGLALGDTIYLSDYYFELFDKGQHPVILEALIAHEAEHLERFKILGRLSVVRYFLDPKFRLQEEIHATKIEIAVFNKRGEKFDYAGRARSWSSINYFFMVGHEEALRILTSL